MTIIVIRSVGVAPRSQAPMEMMLKLSLSRQGFRSLLMYCDPFGVKIGCAQFINKVRFSFFVLMSACLLDDNVGVYSWYGRATESAAVSPLFDLLEAFS